MDQVVTANRLSDGVVVFLASGPGAPTTQWKLRLEEATVARDDAEADALLALGRTAAELQHRVVEPYLIEVERSASGLRPTRYRELIRCLGPTVRPDLGKQAEPREV